ncbi:MAG: cysteine--tRNA ligase [Bacteroidetes bacterium]|nr:cysteine--tRNA ligase [Bacteroidota bacterium]
MPLFEQYPLSLYNSMAREKQLFEPLAPPFVGLYTCGPTVYSEPHLGHARGLITWDLVFRYLRHLGYRVRYVRNITDVGHLEDEVTDAGEDKITKKARLERLEPMEVVQQYTVAYRKAAADLNALSPSIEPTASGHVPEQIQAIKNILSNGYAYERDGSVYFNLARYAASHPYGKLSGKVLDDLIAGSRQTEGLNQKQSPHDFALWKKASPEHIMRWDSPWGQGFPGWHIECSAMSTKYLGETFDLHGGGMDLLFPHHEAEIAQNVGCCGNQGVRYWIHHNMLTIEGQKMARSLGNFISIEQVFSGNHPLLEQAYSPMTVRFFTLQSHYRSPVDFSNEGLQAAEKSYRRLMNAAAALDKLEYRAGAFDAELERQIQEACHTLYRELSDDFNTPRALAVLFELSSRIQDFRSGNKVLGGISADAFAQLQQNFKAVLFDVFGLLPETQAQTSKLDGVMDMLIRMRTEARASKDFAASDRIRDELLAIGIQLKDGKEGTTFSVEG